MKYVLLMKDTPVGPEVADVGPCEEKELRVMAEVALENGWRLMFECSAPLDMAEVAANIQSGKSVSSMPGVDRLWKLGE